MTLTLRPVTHCRAIAALLLPLALAGCTGTRFGEVLSRSFSGAPPTPAAAPPLAADSKPVVSGSAASPSKTSPPAKTLPPAKTAAKAPATPAGATPAGLGSGAAAVAPLPRRPAPYRVTILLPQADASAPAEVVTQALRSAGVPFEVETIERIGVAASQPGQGSAAPLPQSAPTIRPAPAPR